MSYDDYAEGVAEDYREALEGLTMNSRVEINNLTLIARENTEYGHAISEVLLGHIRKVAPQKKLPAMYVLDSIVKNVGTPYTLFFGRNLYKTFMEAYASVDGGTRRKMDEMLKTWKEPVPGSIDSRPVFPLDVVRPIENALIQARTSALQAQQEHMRSQQQLLGKGRGPMPYRETPTPPGVRPGSQPSVPYARPLHPGMNGNQPSDMAQTQQTYPVHTAHVPTTKPSHGMQASMPYPPPPIQGSNGALPLQPWISIESLNDDIAQLIAATKAAFAQNPLDASVQSRLKALLDLQTLLQTQSLPQKELVLVKNQVAELAVNIRGPPAQNITPTPQNYVLHPPHSHKSTPVGSQAVAPAPPASVPPAPVTVDGLLGKGALAALLAKKPAAPQGSMPQPPPAVPAPRTPPPAATGSQGSTPAPAAGGNPLALLSMLRNAGLLSGTAGAATGSPLLAPTPVSLPLGIPSVAIPSGAAPFRTPPVGHPDEITLKASSLKQFRPHLIATVYDDLGPPCSQCGRRFRTDQQGRAKKMGHMDWHFRVHQRIAEAEKRGQHRSWYLDSADWIKSREAIDVDHVPTPDELKSADEAGGGAGNSSRGAPKLRWIPVPDRATTANSVCPICQEKFETKWLDETQEWVWMDAMRVGDRVYHASCHSEVTGNGGDGAGASAGVYSRNTPDPVLGKRKAEQDELYSSRGKVKYEGLPY